MTHVTPVPGGREAPVGAEAVRLSRSGLHAASLPLNSGLSIERA